MKLQNKNIFKVEDLQFPYLYKFPGQNSDEVILYVTREHRVMLYFRLLMVFLISIILVFVGYAITGTLASFFGKASLVGVNMLITGIASLFILIGSWWVKNLWKKSLAFVTNKRLTKIIYTTPFNRHTLSLPLEMIVDTGSYDRGFIQAILRLGTFTARSSAASSGVATGDNTRVNKKYFYIENIGMVEDLQHYVSKVLSNYRKNSDKLISFRPFIPKLKGSAREEFMKQFPEYWS
jgi:hypothetical protein